jgi:hypothetical protein
MAPPTKRGASTIAVLRAAREELERAKEVVDFDERRKAICDWARGLGYKEWDGIPNNYQRWRDGVVAKFGRQAKGLDDDGPPEGSSLRPPPPPLPSSAASNKAIRTPPAAQASSEQQPSAIRQRVLLPPSLLLLPSERDAQFQAQWDAREKAWTAQLQARDKAWAESLQACKALQEGWAAEREKEWKETWAAREKAWAAQSKWEEAWEHAQACVDKWEIPHLSLGVLLDHSVTSLAMAAFAMFVLLCLDVLAMFASVCTLVGNLGASE